MLLEKGGVNYFFSKSVSGVKERFAVLSKDEEEENA